MNREESFYDAVPVVAGSRVLVAPDDFRSIRTAVERGDRWYVAGFVRDGERVAFVQNRWSDGWVLPGGSMETGESKEAAVEREVREETGLEIADVRPIGAIEQTFYTQGISGTATGNLAVFCAEAVTTAFGTDLGETDDEIEAAAWFDGFPDEVDGLSHDLLERLFEEP